ncbi:uncharacterized protein F4807DRAFT_433706 [Annulohypoxylon truncatum]|uniref:uncharacterized protein n=1 Tax=Annulohypoxylon truncatum TaxID=327061 RepID=UPI002008E23D|nr:uncharacterized protein F4807DRAFT_433706 [Annulohypoxylon truncatum]KAI1207907.1 hypothetical protein F4807DRAFT_433706 [Annulohypoxylon truncatum]
MTNGMFRCLMNGCGTAIKNEHRNIQSHLDKHNPNSKYRLKQEYKPRLCGVCGKSTTSCNNLIKHVRDQHGVRGSTTAIQEQYATTQDGDVINVTVVQDETG